MAYPFVRTFHMRRVWFAGMLHSVEYGDEE